MMILSVDCDKSRFSAKQFQGCKHLYAFAYRYVGIGISVQEQ